MQRLGGGKTISPAIPVDLSFVNRDTRDAELSVGEGYAAHGEESCRDRCPLSFHEDVRRITVEIEWGRREKDLFMQIGKLRMEFYWLKK